MKYLCILKQQGIFENETILVKNLWIHNKPLQLLPGLFITKAGPTGISMQFICTNQNVSFGLI